MKYLYTLFIASLSFAIANGQTLHEAEPNLDGTFGGAVHNHHFNVPVGSEGWAGYANNNTSIYPLSFVNGGKITFTASASADTTVRFRFEANPYPNVDPAYDTASTAITAAEATYEIAIPASANTYNSALFYVEAQGVDVFLEDVKYIAFDADGTTTLTESLPWFNGVFGGAVYKQKFNVPVGSEGWAGYANNNTSIYPITFATNGGKITFTASASADTTVRFRFEANPYPNVDPAYDTASTAITAAEATYEIAIPASANTYNSALFYVEAQGVDVFLKDVKYISDDTFTVSKTQDFELSLYPNPVKDIATISSTESVDLIRVFDMTGRIVKQATPNRNNFDLDVANLSKGVYLVKLNAGDKEATTKLIK